MESLEIHKIESPDFIYYLYDDMGKTFLNKGGEVLYMGIDNSRFDHYEVTKLDSYKTFEQQALRHGIRERLIFREGDTHFLSARNVYRWIPEEYFADTPLMVYGDNVAMILWGPPSRLLIIRNRAAAETYRKQFEALWSMATPVPDDVFERHRLKK